MTPQEAIDMRAAVGMTTDQKDLESIWLCRNAIGDDLCTFCLKPFTGPDIALATVITAGGGSFAHKRCWDARQEQ